MSRYLITASRSGYLLGEMTQPDPAQAYLAAAWMMDTWAVDDVRICRCRGYEVRSISTWTRAAGRWQHEQLAAAELARGGR